MINIITYLSDEKKVLFNEQLNIGLGDFVNNEIDLLRKYSIKINFGELNNKSVHLAFIIDGVLKIEYLINKEIIKYDDFEYLSETDDVKVLLRKSRAKFAIFDNHGRYAILPVSEKDISAHKDQYIVI